MNDNSNKRNGIIAAVVVILIILAAIIVYGMINDANDATNNSQDTTVQENTSEQTEQSESQLEQITENPSSFIGKTVTVAGEVQDVFSQQAFKIADQTAGEELLIVFPEALPAERAQEAEQLLADNANAQVTGVVRVATLAEYESDYGLLFDDPGVEVEFEGKPVLVATNVMFTDASGMNFDYTFDFDVDATINNETN